MLRAKQKCSVHSKIAKQKYDELHFVAYEHLAVTQHSRWNDQTFSLAELNRLPHAFRQVLLDAQRDGHWVQSILNILAHEPYEYRNDLWQLRMAVDKMWTDFIGLWNQHGDARFVNVICNTATRR